MVWGMNLPASFGEFFPDGAFEGGMWSERLNSFYQSQPLEVQMALYDFVNGGGVTSYPYFVSQKFKNEVGTNVRPEGPPFTPVRPHEAPISFVSEKSYTTLGALIKLESMILAVNEAFKTIIEQIEPGIHQFFPVEIIMPDGEVYPHTYYTIVIGQYFDSFLPDRSKPGSFRPDGPDYYFHQETKAGLNGIALSKTIFGNAHLWRERRLSGEWLTCFSDQLRMEIEKAGLRVPPLYQMMEV